MRVLGMVPVVEEEVQDCGAKLVVVPHAYAWYVCVPTAGRILVGELVSDISVDEGDGCPMVGCGISWLNLHPT